MVELVRVSSATCIPSYGSSGERKSSRKYRNPDFRCFCRDLENFVSITQSSLWDSSISKVSMFGGTTFLSLHGTNIIQRGCFVAESDLYSCLVVKKEARLQPKIEETGLQPKIEEIGLQPKIEETGLQSKIEETGLQPKIEETGLQPKIEETGLQTKIEESGLVVLDRNTNDEFGVAGFGKMQMPKMNLKISEELDNVPFSDLQRFKISELKVHFLEVRDEDVLSKRILSLSRSNKVRSALELYLSMDVAGLRTSAHACNSLLACLVRNRSIDDALLVFGIMRNKGLPTGHTYSLILKAVASTKGSKEATENFNSFENDGVSLKIFDIVVYNTMISICGKARDWVETERIWSKFKQINLSGTMITYSLLISSFVQCGQTELALDAFHEMITRGLEPDEGILKAIIASCTRDGKWDFALNIFRKMLESGIKPSVISYNSMINCLGKSGEDTLAFRVYELMKVSGLEPDIFTWSALLISLYRSKRYADALSLFETFRALSVSQSHCQLYNIALLSCQRLRLWERSLQLLWQMEKSGMEVSSVSYNHVIQACEAAKRPEVALQVYQHMIEQKLKPDMFTYLSLIRACIWGSLWTEVENLLECIPLDASLYNTLVQGFFLRGKILLAKKMYTKMRSIGLNTDGKTRAMMLQHLSANGINQRVRNGRFRKW